VFVDSYGTGTVPDKDILAAIKAAFDFRCALEMKTGGAGRGGAAANSN
jgi:S-adenosylmethionine synthetase